MFWKALYINQIKTVTYGINYCVNYNCLSCVVWCWGLQQVGEIKEFDQEILNLEGDRKRKIESKIIEL